MTVLTESPRPGEFIVSEANGSRSREVITVLSGQSLLAGAVLGKVLIGAAVAAAVAGGTGNGTIGAVTVGAAKAGIYRVTCIEPATDGGKFTIEDPDGIAVGTATVGAAFTGGGLTFTIADGSTDFAAGDAFTITVAAGSGKYVEWDPDNTDGSQTACAVLYAAVDASAADAEGVAISRDAEVRADDLQWFTGASDGNKITGKAHLATAGIISR